MSLLLSVAICTHRPRPDFLARTLEALRGQTLSSEHWELLVIDNASEPPLAPDLSWHPHARVVVEPTLGLTPARLRGFREAATNLVILVDDDNVLAPDYLEYCARIAQEWPHLGVWGGQTIAEFEVQPPAWATPYLWLAIREFQGDRWSNVPFTHEAMPFGAGLCVRRAVWEAYSRLVENDSRRRALDRTGGRLLGCGDTDIVLTACDIALGTGLFAGLKLHHLIPKRRIEEDYLLELVESTTYSNTLLKGLRGAEPMRPSRAQRLLQWYQKRSISPVDRKFDQAKERGLEAAARELDRLRQEGQR